jgi:hypothetical protein
MIHRMEPEPSILAIHQFCIFCNEAIDRGQPRATIHTMTGDRKISPTQLDAHLSCVKQAAHREMIERIDAASADASRHRALEELRRPSGLRAVIARVTGR